MSEQQPASKQDLLDLEERIVSAIIRQTRQDLSDFEERLGGQTRQVVAEAEGRLESQTRQIVVEVVVEIVAEAEARIESRARQNLLETESRIVATLKTYVDQRIRMVESNLERVETKLLTAFYEWARPTEIRLRSLTGFARGTIGSNGKR